MQYTSKFAEELQQLDQSVILQKEYDLYEHKKKHIEKMMVLQRNPVQKNRLEQKLQEINRHIEALKKEMSDVHESIHSPRHMIIRYMDLYQVSIPSLARILKINPSVIRKFLTHNVITPETKLFIYWAIQNFRLDANRYLKWMQSLV